LTISIVAYKRPFSQTVDWDRWNASAFSKQRDERHSV